jgi:hypothetical protein
VVAGLVLVALLCGTGLLLFAGNACPTQLPRQPCPGADANRVIVIVLAAVAVTLLVTPFAFLAEFALRRRIVYRGSWGRALRRGILAGTVIVVLAGLRLGGALTIPGTIFVLLLASAVEWGAIRRFDVP